MYMTEKFKKKPQFDLTIAAQNQFFQSIQALRLFFKAITKEIMLERDGNLHQLLQVNTFPPEQFVDIGFLTINLGGKPIDRTTLLAQLFMNQFAHVDVFHNKTHSSIIA